MHEVRSTRQMTSPKTDVWQVLDGFGGVAEFTPAVNSATTVAGPDTGEGSTRECVLEDGGRITETIVECEPGSSFTIEFTDLGKTAAFVKEFTAEDVIAEVDVARHTGRRTHDGEFMGVEPTGNSFEIPGVVVLRIEDGQITEAWVNVDALGLLARLGAVTPPGAV